MEGTEAHKAFPNIRSKKGGRDASVVEGEEGGLEGLEGGSWGGGEVDELVAC